MRDREKQANATKKCVAPTTAIILVRLLSSSVNLRLSLKCYQIPSLQHNGDSYPYCAALLLRVINLGQLQEYRARTFGPEDSKVMYKQGEESSRAYVSAAHRLS